MNIMLNTKSLVLLVATFGILVGFAVSQIAFSNAGGAQVSRTVVVKDPAVVTQLKTLNKRIGSGVGAFGTTDVMSELEDIVYNTGKLCDDLTTSYAICRD